MSRIVPSPRDFEIMKMISRLGFMTETQICTLFYSKHRDFKLDLKRARNAIAQRIAQLLQHGYLAKSTIPGTGTINRVAYLLGPHGAEYLKNTREIEIRQNRRWIEARTNDLMIRSRHDLIATNFLVNLLMLARITPQFDTVNWIPDRDCRFYVEKGENKLLVNPDLFVSIRNGSPEGPDAFIEVDRNTLDDKAIRIKVLRLLQYFVSRKYKKDLGIKLFPFICVLVPTKERLEAFQRIITSTKTFYSDDSSEKVSRVSFFMTTFDQVEVDSIERGFVSTKPLEGVWVNEQGTRFVSPLLPKPSK